MDKLTDEERRKTDTASGMDTGARRIGTLALWLIPAALACAASGWFGVYWTQHQIRRELSQEERAAIATGDRNDLAKENAYLRAKLGLKPDEDIVDGLGLKRPHL